MKTIHFFYLVIAFTFLIGCKKDTVGPTVTTPTYDVYSSRDVQTSPVYFDFDIKDTVTVNNDWDIMLKAVPIQGSPYPLPAILLNEQKNVLGKIINGETFSSINQTIICRLCCNR